MFKVPPTQTLHGVFEAGGDGVSIIVPGGEAVVESIPPSPFVYAALAKSVNRFVVHGLRALNCNHVCVDGGPEHLVYDAVHTEGADANVARYIEIVGGGAHFDTRPGSGHAACLVRYAFDWSVSDCSYDTVLSGVEWWGGDANPVTGDGKAGAERKCGRFAITNVQARHTAISGIWGSMGTDGVVENCLIADTGDVGFDSEGSARIVFRNCEATDGRNGCFGTFFLNDTITFERCRATSSKSGIPLFSVTNPTLDMANNRHIAIQGGRWTCTDQEGPATLGTAGGPCAELTISDAQLVNARIDTAHVGLHATEINGNTLLFPYPDLSSAAIRVGGSKTLAPSHTPGTVIVRGNRIVLSAGKAPTAIQLFEDDTISSASAKIEANDIAGPFATGIALVNASPNPAVRPSAALARNVFELSSDAQVTSASTSGGALHAPTVHWVSGRDGSGRSISAASALHQG